MNGDTVLNPAKWRAAASGENIVAGDTIWLADGVYFGRDIYIEGTALNPVIVRPIHPSMVTIDGTFSASSLDLHFYDINFTDSNPNRYDITNAVYAPNGTISFYGCLFSDEHTSGLNWYGGGTGEVCECVFINNGNRYPDDSKHGHALYTHNSSGTRLIARNIFGYSFGDYGLQIYSGNNSLLNYTVEDNITYYPTHTGGLKGLENFIYRRNVQLAHPLNLGKYAINSQNQVGDLSDNVAIDSAVYVNTNGNYPEWLNLTESGNLVLGGTDPQRAGWTYSVAPTTWSRVIPFAKSLRWKASVAVFNRDGAENVAVDFSGIPNGNYKLRNAQNPAETWSFVNAGSPVSVPMDFWTCAQRIGDVTPPSTYPIYGAFVVEAG